MYKAICTLGAIAALAATATAHGTVTGVTVDGVFTGGFKLDYYYAKQSGGKIPENVGWYAENLDNGFVAPDSFTKSDIICHKSASSAGSSDSLVKVAAGGTVDFHWTAWPESHVGPVITYVAPYTGSIASVKKEDLKWTKIQADGFANGQWAAIKMIKDNNTASVTVPSSLKAGKYVFRHEIIALHSAGSANGAQAYPQCLNIEVTGSGTTVPEGVAGTSIYEANEDGIIFNVYTQNIKYNIPGPPLMGAGSGSAPTTPTTPTKPSTTKPTTPTVVPSAAPSKAPSAAPSAAPVATPAAPSNGDGSLPKEFTIETFISWLEGKASTKVSTRATNNGYGKFRGHARSFA